MGAILVTGAAGFIGSHVVEALLARGDWVVGVDNFDPFYSAACKRRNLAVALAHPRFRLVEHDIRDGTGLAACWERALPPEAPAISVVAHLAARGRAALLARSRTALPGHQRARHGRSPGVRPAIWRPSVRTHLHVIGLRQQPP